MFPGKITLQCVILCDIMDKEKIIFESKGAISGDEVLDLIPQYGSGAQYRGVSRA